MDSPQQQHQHHFFKALFVFENTMNTGTTKTLHEILLLFFSFRTKFSVPRTDLMFKFWFLFSSCVACVQNWWEVCMCMGLRMGKTNKWKESFCLRRKAHMWKWWLIQSLDCGDFRFLSCLKAELSVYGSAFLHFVLLNFLPVSSTSLLNSQFHGIQFLFLFF